MLMKYLKLTLQTSAAHFKPMQWQCLVVVWDFCGCVAAEQGRHHEHPLHLKSNKKIRTFKTVTSTILLKKARQSKKKSNTFCVC